MSRCLRCLYALIKGGCPVCGGKRIKGVPPFIEKAGPVVEQASPPLPTYWSPR